MEIDHDIGSSYSTRVKFQDNPGEVIKQFDLFINTIDDEIFRSININENQLTNNVFKIQRELLEHYKEINGTAAGFNGISEYIVFSAFKNFIEYINKEQEFKCKVVNSALRCFELKKIDKSLVIYRSSSLNHLPPESRKQLFKDSSKKLRAPDISILKKDKDRYKLLAIIEIKNYLDKGSANSAIDMLNQIRDDLSKSVNTSYALFSFSKISIGNEETKDKLIKYKNYKNNFLITNEENGNGKFGAGDLSKFFESIQEEIKL